MARFVSKRDETVRLFDNPVMEYLSRAHPATPLFYAPVLILCAYFAVVEQGWLAAGLAFAAGVLIWTLTEYWIHRSLFHYQPKAAWARRMAYLWHGVHHDYPRDHTRLVMPLMSSLPLAVMFYCVFWLVAGKATPGVFAGFALGYIAYDLTHYAIHHWPLRNRVFLWLRKNHLRHHFADEHAGYGVTSPLWDYVFRTQYRAGKHVARRHAEAPAPATPAAETPLAAPNG